MTKRTIVKEGKELIRTSMASLKSHSCNRNNVLNETKLLIKRLLEL